MQDAPIYLSVVIPAYKEVDNIKRGVLETVSAYLTAQPYTWEVLIVDDGSPDETADLAETFVRTHDGFRVLREPHRGKGGTVIAGMLAAQGEIVLFADMDQATPLSEVEKLLPCFDAGYDGVIGSRSGRQGAPLVRKVMAHGFRVLRTIVLRLPYHDTQCGFKAFRGAVVPAIFGRMQIFNERSRARAQGAAVTAGFDLEVLYIARKLSLKMAEVPVEWHHQGTRRVHPIKDSWQGLLDLLRVRINAFAGRYSV
ncbi:glycosyltransferase [Aggregatilinea lenta]|uniref:glycosyltransferase n=1 Tax=Aggregatilinea lenta TaxID=913108 RepID=UPI0013C325F5|nr:glycosyltransferase [Aggregatilinea lenta]